MFIGDPCDPCLASRNFLRHANELILETTFVDSTMVICTDLRIKIPELAKERHLKHGDEPPPTQSQVVALGFETFL